VADGGHNGIEMVKSVGGTKPSGVMYKLNRRRLVVCALFPSQPTVYVPRARIHLVGTSDVLGTIRVQCKEYGWMDELDG
jgi:hypothetical protein